MLGQGFDDVLERAQHGDRDAFAALWRDTYPPLLRYLHTLRGDAAEGQAARAWGHVAEGLRRFSGDEQDLRRWLVAVARTDDAAAAAHRPPRAGLGRDATGDPRPVGERRPGRGGDVGAAARVAEPTRSALALIGRLREDQAEPILLRVVLGLDVADVADATSRPPGDVRRSVHSGLRHLEPLLTMTPPASVPPARTPSPLAETALTDGAPRADGFGPADLFLAGRRDALGEELDALFTAAAAPTTGAERAAADVALEAFLRRPAVTPGRAAAQDRTMRRVAAAIVVAGVLMGGMAVAAGSAGALPTPVQRVANVVGHHHEGVMGAG